MELNPNHPVVNEVRDHWHKIVAIMLHKFGLGDVRISVADIDAMNAAGLGAVVLQEKGEYMELRLVSMDEAERLARKEGGLPF